MRISRTLTAVAAAALIVPALTGAAAATAGASATAGSAAACTPVWGLVKTPAPPGSLTQLDGVSAVSGNDAWFAGWEPAYGVSEQAWVLHWTGSSLRVATAIPPALPPASFTTRSVTTASFDSATDGWAVGDSPNYNTDNPVPYAARWHGGRWAITPLAISSDPASTTSAPRPNAVVSLSPSDAWVVGGLGASQGNQGALIEHWDGTTWSMVPNPRATTEGSFLSALTVVSPTDIWAVGEQHPNDGAGIPLVEHFDGTSWKLVSAPPGNQISGLQAVSADGPSDIWAVGSQVEKGTASLAAAFVEHWNGKAWTIAAGLPDFGNSTVTAVYAANPDDVWAAVETVANGGGLTVNDFLHWDGTAWAKVPVPGPHEYSLHPFYTAMGGTGSGNIWAAGYSYDSTGETPLLAHLSCRSQ